MFKTGKLYQPLLAFLMLAALLFTGLPHQTVQAATFTVTKTADTADDACDSDCSLREAIIAANAAPGDDTITLPAGTYTLSITGTGEDAAATGDLDITGNLTINGAGNSTTTINGGGIDRVFESRPAAGTTLNVTIANVTITNGSVTVLGIGGGGFADRGTSTGITNLTMNDVVINSNTGTNNGGGGIGIGRNISAIGNPSLTLNRSTVSNNTAVNGGGIYCSRCNLNISNSSITGNTATNTTLSNLNGGGGINITGTGASGTLSNVTISGNKSNMHGGGIVGTVTSGSMSLAINFSTITNNTADFDNNASGDGGGMYKYEQSGATATITIQNSIVQSNTDSSTLSNNDCYANVAIASNGYNVVGSGTGCPSGGTSDTTASANLGTLQVNGVVLTWLQTHLPSVGSAAIDRIPNGSSGCVGGTSIDERGAVRADGLNRGGSACDSGAVEGDSIEQPNAITLQQFRAVVRPTPALLFGLLLALGGLAYLAWRKR